MPADGMANSNIVVTAGAQRMNITDSFERIMSMVADACSQWRNTHCYNCTRMPVVFVK
jgi:hypothetical protein